LFETIEAAWGFDFPQYRAVLHDQLVQGERELNQMFRAAPSRIAPAGAVLAVAERPSQSLYALHRGWACRIREWRDGRQVIPQIYAPGDYIGLEAMLLARPIDEVVAVETVTVKVLDADAVSGMLSRPSSATYLASLLTEAQRRAERRADRLSRFEALERLAEMLVDLHERVARRGTTGHRFSLPLTQQRIADHLGLTIVHVNRTLRLLREERIATIDRQVVDIHDMAALRTLARRDMNAWD
jgi:CRP/FNR family transcriptional regulator